MTYKNIIKKQIKSISDKLYNSSSLVLKDWEKILIFDWTEFWDIAKEFNTESIISLNELIDYFILQNNNKYWTEYKVVNASWRKMEWWWKIEKIARIIYEIQVWEYSEEEWKKMIKDILEGNEE